MPLKSNAINPMNRYWVTITRFDGTRNVLPKTNYHIYKFSNSKILTVSHGVKANPYRIRLNALMRYCGIQIGYHFSSPVIPNQISLPPEFVTDLPLKSDKTGFVFRNKQTICECQFDRETGQERRQMRPMIGAGTKGAIQRAAHFRTPRNTHVVWSSKEEDGDHDDARFLQFTYARWEEKALSH